MIGDFFSKPVKPWRASRVRDRGRFSPRALHLCVRLFAVVALLMGGCDRSGLNLAPVSGVVTYNGAPVEKAGVIFMPESGPPAMGTTDAEGEFTLRTANRPGALVGNHRVSISKTETTATQIPGERLPRYGTKYHLPEKYASPSTSELTATVSDDDNSFRFELTGKISGS
jgi:hypothetical protein